MYPVEFVKTQMQLKETAGGGKSQGMFAVAKSTYQAKGILGFYKGLPSLVAGAIPKAGIRFLSYNQIKRSIEEWQGGKTNVFGSIVAGVGTGIMESTFAVTPAETIKTKLIHDQNSPNPRFRGMTHGVYVMVQEGGLGAIYKGWVATTMRQCTNSAVRFPVYEAVTTFQRRDNPKRAVTFAEGTIAGVIAGTINCYVSMPVDVVKTRMQGLRSSQYTGVVNCFSTIVQKEGVLALWKGTVPRLSRLSFSGGIIFGVQAQATRFLNENLERGKRSSSGSSGSSKKL